MKSVIPVRKRKVGEDIAELSFSRLSDLLRSYMPKVSMSTRKKVAKTMQLLAENGELWRNIPALGGCSYQQYMSLRRVYPETVGRLQDECLSRAEAVRVIKREEAAHSRAVDGYDEPIYYKGEQCGTVRKFSDRLLELLLMADNPKYRRSEQVVNVSTNMLMQQLQAGAAVGQAADVIGAGWDLEETDGDISASQIPAVPARRRS